MSVGPVNSRRSICPHKQEPRLSAEPSYHISEWIRAPAESGSSLVITVGTTAGRQRLSRRRRAVDLP